MIYLIGGAPRCGKTTIAKKLSKKLQIPWISADTIESIVAINTSSKEIKKLFPKSIIRKKTNQSNDIMHNLYSAKDIVKAYIKQAKSSWRAIEMMVACELNEGNDYIIEGHQVHPKLMSKLIKKYDKNIISLVLTRFDKDGIVSGCQKHKAKNDWFIQKTKNKETFYKIAEMIKVYSEFFEKEARKYDVKVINMDDNFSKQLKDVIIIFSLKG